MRRPILLMLKVYAVPVSLYCAKLRIVLRHKQLEWEEIPPPGGYGSEEYKALVPGGSLPALEHDGLLLSDSEAIAEYLNEAFPEPDMLPGGAAGRTKIRELSRFHDTRLEPALRKLFRFIGNTGKPDQQVADIWAELKERLTQIEDLLPQSRPQLTLGDCGIPITCCWIDALSKHFGYEAGIGSRMKTYLALLSGHKAVKDELAAYRPRLEEWLASR